MAAVGAWAAVLGNIPFLLNSSKPKNRAPMFRADLRRGTTFINREKRIGVDFFEEELEGLKWIAPNTITHEGIEFVRSYDFVYDVAVQSKLTTKEYDQ